jgi:hypothetical protein
VIEEDIQREWDSDEEESSEEASSDATEEELPQNDKEDLPPTHNKEINELGENLQSLQITDNKQENMADDTTTLTDTTSNWGKSMVPEPGFFDGTRTKFKD